MTLNVDPREPGAGRVIADGVGPATKVGFMQQEGEGGREEDKQRKLKRERPPHVPLAEPGKALRIVIERLIAQQDIGDAAIQAHGADGDHNGRQVKAGHQQAVEQAAQQTYAQADDHQQRSVHPRCRAEAHHR